MNIPPDLLASIQEALNNGTLTLGSPGARSPLRPRQLHDLRLMPTKDDPRPTFFWSAEAPRNAVDLARVTEFPKLLWHGDSGQEVTAISGEEQARYLSMGYQFTAPSAMVIDPMDVIRAEWERFSPEDQAAIVASQQKDRIAAMVARLSTLPEDRLEALLTTAAPTETKRGPGRPRKDAA